MLMSLCTPSRRLCPVCSRIFHFLDCLDRLSCRFSWTLLQQCPKLAVTLPHQKRQAIKELLIDQFNKTVSFLPIGLIIVCVSSISPLILSAYHPFLCLFPKPNLEITSANSLPTARN